MRVIIAILALILSIPNAYASDEIVVTIKPLHSLVAGIVGDTASAKLLLKDSSSPHNFALKPSQMKMLHNAKVIFYINEHFESFISKALRTLPPDIKSVAVANSANIELLKQRHAGAWDSHHNKESNDDLHIWLDPKNAIIIVQTIAKKLSALFPENKQIYRDNAINLIKKLDKLDQLIALELSAVKSKPFIVFHDGFQYFEHAYDLNFIGSIATNPHDIPSISRIKKLRSTLQDSPVICAFSEPQFSDKIIKTVIEGSNTKITAIDLLAQELKIGENLYFELLKNLTSAIKQCLN